LFSILTSLSLSTYYCLPLFQSQEQLSISYRELKTELKIGELFFTVSFVAATKPIEQSFAWFIDSQQDKTSSTMLLGYFNNDPHDILQTLLIFTKERCLMLRQVHLSRMHRKSCTVAGKQITDRCQAKLYFAQLAS